MTLPYHIGGALYGVALVALGIAAWWAPTRWPNLWRHVPRERWIGGAIGAVGVYWSLTLAALMLEDWTKRFTPTVVLLLTVLFTVACILLLDYLLTRALAGMLLLLANWMMAGAFVEEAPWRGVLSLTCYILSLCTLWVIAEPYRFRDLLRRLPQHPPTRFAVAGVLGSFGIVAIVVAWGSQHVN